MFVQDREDSWSAVLVQRSYSFTRHCDCRYDSGRLQELSSPSRRTHCSRLHRAFHMHAYSYIVIHPYIHGRLLDCLGLQRDGYRYTDIHVGATNMGALLLSVYIYMPVYTCVSAYIRLQVTA